ncbi:MAG: heterodisulfide reductase-related iron-sulfur binding cluster [Anaerolineales bacterium]
MLSLPEKIIFILACVLSFYFTYVGVKRIVAQISSGQGKVDWSLAVKRLGELIIKIGLFKPLFRMQKRLVPSIVHAIIGWGFIGFLVILLGDFIKAFTGIRILERLGLFGDAYRLLAEILNIGLVLGAVFMGIRRFVFRPKVLTTRRRIKLVTGVRYGITRDSAIVLAFIFVHNGLRYLEESFAVALAGKADSWQPTISLLASLWSKFDPAILITAQHVAFWISMGTLLAFLPYFPYSKHIHIFFAPLNHALKPERPSIGQARPSHGAEKMKDLGWEQIMDSYACIMCFRCQEVCPAYNTGKPLSPAAYEVNKRYYLKLGGDTSVPLNHLITSKAVWSCTTCGACVNICPVNNEPLEDIIDIRRHHVVNGAIDSGIQTALQSLATNGNSMGKGKRLRGKWAKELEKPVKNVMEESVDTLWFVGDTASFDDRLVPITQTTARIFDSAGLDFGILYQNEFNAGNEVRRVGEEGLFEQLVEQNMNSLNKAQFKRIVTTDPHSFNTLKNEYPQFGGTYEVEHYTTVLAKLFDEGRLKIKHPLSNYRVTFHDPCYLGRYNGGFAAPRKLLKLLGVEFVEMPRNCENSFCCGAGGGHLWMGNNNPGVRPGEVRVREAVKALGEDQKDKKHLLVVTCPKDYVMFSYAVKTSHNEHSIEVREMIELIAEAIELDVPHAEQTLAIPA